MPLKVWRCCYDVGLAIFISSIWRKKCSPAVGATKYNHPIVVLCYLGCHSLLIFMPYKVLWELLVYVFVHKWIRAICCKKTCKHALFIFAMFKHMIEGFYGVKNHEVIIWQMDLQVYNGWVLVTNRELKKAPSSLHCCDVASVFEF
jgi:hypothetical protein